MKICHIGHGMMPIPPRGWGAVESVISDYKDFIELAGHECFVINDREPDVIVAKINRLNPDVVHSHYEEHFPLLSQFPAPVKLLCTHASSIMREENLGKIKAFMTGHTVLVNECYICCLSEEMRRYFVHLGVPRARILLVPNGARGDLIRYADSPELPDRSLCLAQVTRRKRQHLLSGIEFVDFVGPKNDPTFECSPQTYLGEWTRAEVFSNLTQYANLVLLSSSELAPLVTCQALMAGLGLVLSESASANLDRSLPFIDIIPEERVKDASYVRLVLRHNQEYARKLRREIRSYGLDHFDWGVLVPQYLETIQALIPTAASPREGSL